MCSSLVEPHKLPLRHEYDTKDQLTQEQTTRGPGITDAFGYDTAGNPTNFKGTTKTGAAHESPRPALTRLIGAPSSPATCLDVVGP